MEDRVFAPTATSQLLIRAVSKAIEKPGKLLDLGCGSGVVGIALVKAGKATGHVYFSDVSKEATTASTAAYDQAGIPSQGRMGSLFEPWAGCTFDTIVDDVSGVAEEIAQLSPWFEGVPCDSGRDGTNLICEVLKQAPSHLNPGGRLFFPVLSLSDEIRILLHARHYFSNVKLLKEQFWFLPPELDEHLDLVKKLNADGLIRVESRFGKPVWFTKIYEASA